MAKGGHTYFLYDNALRSVRFEGDGPVAQARPNDIFTFSDAFVGNGLVAAAALIDRPALPRHLNYLQRVIAAIEAGRFQIDEKAELSAANVTAKLEDFGPRMILLGAAGMLSRAGLAEHAEPWASRITEQVLSRYFDPGKGVLRNIPGNDVFNAGHGIEFVGFALEHLGPAVDSGLFSRLITILDRSLAMSMGQHGIALSVNLNTGERLAPWHPWWCLPEAIRACALALRCGAATIPRCAIGGAESTMPFSRTSGSPNRAMPIKLSRPTDPPITCPPRPISMSAITPACRFLAAQNANPFA